MFTQLDATRILETIDRLEQRVAERFPDSGLRQVAGEVCSTSRQLCLQADALGSPHWVLRITAVVLIAGLIVATIFALGTLLAGERVSGPTTLTDIAQGIESAINDVVFLGIAVYFILSWERRVKRKSALQALHQLRSLAHVVDMHQLTKDPDRIMRPQEDTASSPDRTMTVQQMGRYLDYCSELLSLLGKVAALFPQRFDDHVVLEAASDIETLTIGLSRKVWQKITMLQSSPA